MTNLCPCGSSRLLHDCCGKYIDQQQYAATAEQLMRSRYTAFVLGESDYLLQTWHSSTRPASLSGLHLQWFHLAIVATEQGMPDDDRGMVSFIASYRQGIKAKQLHERSRFVREEGRWYYVDGDCHSTTIGRNDACPCGSNHKFKRCWCAK
jgi:SEC-C motif-containing protein